MCGRFSLATDPEVLREEFGVADLGSDVVPRYNIAPQTPVLAIGVSRDGERRAGMLRWGLVPRWVRDPTHGPRMINARAETLASRPAFRESFAHRRCLILADGFYEWRREGGRKVPMRIRRPDGRPFALAGIWDRWRGPDGEPLYTCAIVTTAANQQVAPIHDRMPLILNEADREVWLDPAGRGADLARLLRPYPGPLNAYEVSPIVNAAANDVPACIEPVTGATAGVRA